MLFFLIRNKEFSSQCKWFGAIGTVVVLLSGVLPLFCGVGVRPGFLCTETARGPRRATEKPPPPTQCRHWRRHKMLSAAPDHYFSPGPLFQSTAAPIHRWANPPLGQSTAGPTHRDSRTKIAGRQVPKCKHSESQWSSWSSGLPPC